MSAEKADSKKDAVQRPCNFMLRNISQTVHTKDLKVAHKWSNSLFGFARTPRVE